MIHGEGLEARFARYVSPCPITGCHWWTGGVTVSGYGSINVNGKTNAATRVAWALARGPIAPDLHVLHKCDQPSCVNVAHLFLGTHGDNMADRNRKGRQARLGGHLNPAAKLTPAQVLEIRASSEPRQVLADRYGVKWDSIDNILRRKTWRHI